ncbi:MAG: MCP four helix bundle domain-containing protein [Mycobacterium leprae]
MKLKIATKMLAGFLSLVVLLGVVAYLGIQGLGQVTTSYQDLTNRTDVMLVQAQKLNTAESTANRAIFGYLLTQDSQFKSDYDTAKKQTADAIAQLKSMARAQEAKDAISQAEAADSAFEALV